MESRFPALQADSLPAELSVFWRIQYAYLPFQCQLRLMLPLQLKYRDFSTILVPFSSSFYVVIVLHIKYTNTEITLENFKIFLSVIIVARRMTSQGCPHSNHWNPGIWKGNFVRVIKNLLVKNYLRLWNSPSVIILNIYKLRTFLNCSQRIRENVLCEGLSPLFLALRIGEEANEPRNVETL